MKHSDAYKEKKLDLKKQEASLREKIDQDSAQLEKFAGRVILLSVIAFIGFIAFSVMRKKSRKVLKAKRSGSRFWGLVTSVLPWAIDYFLFSKKFKR